MTLTEAVEIVRWYSLRDVRLAISRVPDPMFQSVCQWRLDSSLTWLYLVRVCGFANPVRESTLHHESRTVQAMRLLQQPRWWSYAELREELCGSKTAIESAIYRVKSRMPIERRFYKGRLHIRGQHVTSPFAKSA
jgi:hypothetical protein